MFAKSKFAVCTVAFVTVVQLSSLGGAFVSFAYASEVPAVGEAEPAEETAVAEESAIEEAAVVEEPAVEEEVAVEGPAVVEEPAVEETTPVEFVLEPIVETIAPAQAPVVSGVEPPELSTDKADYAPTEKVTIFGRFFEAVKTFALKIFGGSQEEETYIEHNDEVTTGEDGGFTYEYQLDGVYRPLYEVVVSTLSGAELARTTFTDAPPAVSLEQCRNGGVGDPAVNCEVISGPLGWATGNAGKSNAHYAEGQSIPYRAVLTSLPTNGTPIELTLGYDIKHSGAHAIDYLTHYDRIAEDVLPTSGTTAPGTFTTYPIPAPSSAGSPAFGEPTANFNSLPAGERVMTLFGGTISNVEYVTQGNLNASQSETRIKVTFTASSATAVLAWGGHIGDRAYWGEGNSAGGISGSPYHMRTIGWNLNNLGNQDRSLSADAVLAPAGGSITIVKNTIGGNGTFNYTTSNATTTPFSITTAGNTGAFAFVNVPAGTYVITEIVPSGWDLTGLTCTDPDNGSGVVLGTGVATIDLDDNESISCTYTNTKLPTLTLVKEVVNDNGGTATAADFQGKIDGGDVPWGVAQTVGVGAHVASETTLVGYTAGSWGGACAADGSVTLSAGQNAVCTITNDDIAPSLTLNKVVVNDDGGTATAASWTLTASGPTGFSGAGPSVSNGASFDAGTYNLSESGPSGYSASAWVCVGGSQSGSQITVGLGESATCTITNGDIAPTLKLVKSVINDNGGGAVADDWTLFADAGFPDDGRNFSNLGGSGAFETVFANVGYVLSESSLPGYAAGSWSCDVGSLVGDTVTLGLGQNATCAIVNDDQPGEIHGQKFEDVNGNGVKDIGDQGLSGWTVFLDTNGNGALDFGEVSTVTDGSGNYSFTGLSAGIYTAREVQQAGWTQTTANPAGIPLSNGQVVNGIDFGNFELGSVHGKKFEDVDGDGLAQEIGEGELPGWTIRLYNTGTNPWTLVATDVTDGNGEYSFENLPPGSYKACEVLDAGWVQTFPNIANNNSSPSNSEEGSRCQTVNIDTSGESNTRNFGNYQIKALVVEKTAETSFTRTFGWTIDKSVTPGTLEMFRGDSGDVEYTVTVTKDNGTDGGWAVSGVITISNPNPGGFGLSATIESVNDAVTNQGTASVDCGVTFPYELPAGGTLNCTYSKTLTDGDDETNTATVVTSGPVPGGSGSATVDFDVDSPTTVVNSSVTVTDTNGGSWPFSDDGSVSYSATFACDADDGTHSNTATIEETNQSDSASVTVNCYALEVTKGAQTSLDRTYFWSIEKTGDQSTLVLSPGQQYVVNYSVTVSGAGSDDSNWAAEGTIAVYNPAPVSATIDSVSDAVSGVGAAAVTCPVTFPYELPAGGTLNCTYSIDLPDDESRTNTATAILANTPNGTTDFSGSASIDFAGAAINEIDESIEVTDTYAGALGTVAVGDTLPKVFQYSRNVGPYELEACGIPQQVENTASFETNDTGTTGSDSYTVNVEVRCVCSLTQGYWKTHSEYGKAPYDSNWENLGDADGDFVSEGQDEMFFSSGQTFYQVLWTAPKGGNAYYQLAHQYIAAKLNVLNGAWGPTVNGDLAAAASLLGGITPAQFGQLKGKTATTLRGQFIALAGVLGAFNEGLTNPAGHCSEPSVN